MTSRVLPLASDIYRHPGRLSHRGALYSSADNLGFRLVLLEYLRSVAAGDQSPIRGHVRSIASEQRLLASALRGATDAPLSRMLETLSSSNQENVGFNLSPRRRPYVGAGFLHVPIRGGEEHCAETRREGTSWLTCVSTEELRPAARKLL
jgi:hypothetical protein